MRPFAWLLTAWLLWQPSGLLFAQQIAGISPTPHQFSPHLRWARPVDASLGARVELFLINDGADPVELGQSSVRFDGQTAEQLLEQQQWTWHDTPSVWAMPAPLLEPSALAVLQFNGRNEQWGIETSHSLSIGERPAMQFQIARPRAWISAVTFRAVDSTGQVTDSPFPNQVFVFVQNDDSATLQIESLTVWLPQDPTSNRYFYRVGEWPKPRCFPGDGSVVGPGKAGCVIHFDEPLPLTYAVLQLNVSLDGTPYPLWAHLRVKHDQFDISGGWIDSEVAGRHSLSYEPFLKTMRRMHINTGHIESVPGYTDQPELYARYPIKLFQRLQDIERFDQAEWLPRIHGVEFLGEPQYGGGRPIPPQEVRDSLAPYQKHSLPTTVTLSEERTWRYYAGLSDFPHFDAYRVTAPAADSWSLYERWGGERIRWGAPLETIGDMTRSLREQSRPRPIGYWSQGAHDGWSSIWNPRRASPNPEELRAQAWQGIANRITSLYWFNLSLPSLLKFPDLIEPITRIGREIRLVDEFVLTGDAYEYRRVDDQGQPAWDLNSIASPDAVLMVVHDLQYAPVQREFRFQPRNGEFVFKVPAWLQQAPTVFRLDADGTHDVEHQILGPTVTIRDEIFVVGVYVLTNRPSLRQQLDAEHARLVAEEASLGFDPAHAPEDLAELEGWLKASP
jgi:hypothetical protein